MSSLVLWIDSEHAKLFTFTPTGVQGQEVRAHGMHEHPTPTEENHFFGDLAKHLNGASEVLVCGPGLAKSHFKSYLEKHHASSLAKRVRGMETVDHPTDAQIQAMARKFFTKLHVFSRD